MGSARAFILGGLFAVALGPVVLIGGCSGGSEETGAQAKVNQKEQEDLQGKMQEFMSKKQGAPKK